MTSDAQAMAAAYVETWKAHDVDRSRSLLADGAEFNGPMAHLHDTDACVEGSKGMSKMVTDIVVQEVIVDGPDVLTWYDRHTAETDPIPTANGVHVEDGKITWISVAFDPGPIAPPGR